MLELGNYAEDATIHFMWSTNDANGASITRATNGTVSVYKAANTTQTTTGITDGEDHDSLTGIHMVTVDTSDAFYATGNDYMVVLSGATIDGQTVNAVLARFSIEKRFDEVDVVKFGGSAGTFSSGRPEVNASHIAGSAVSTSSAQIGVNVVNAGGTAWASGSLTAGVFASDAITAAKVAADVSTEIVTALLATAIETGVTVQQLGRYVGAVLVGERADAGSGTAAFKAVNNSGTTRVTATAAGGNRSGFTLNG